MRSSEPVCDARFVPSNVRNTRSILSGAARHQVDVAETPRRCAEAHRTGDTTEGVLGRPSIFPRESEVISFGGGRWGDPGQAGESVFIRGRLAYEAAAIGRLGTGAMVPEDDMGRQRTGRFR